MFKIFKSSTFKNEESDIRPWVFNRVSNLRKAGFSDKEIISVVSLNDREKELLKLENTLNSIKKETKENNNNTKKESIKIIRRKEIKENNNSKEENKTTKEEEIKEENKTTKEEEIKEENKTTKEEIYNIIDDLSLDMLIDDVYDQFKTTFNVKRDKIEKLIIDIILNDPSIVKTNNYIYTCMKLCSAVEDLIIENTIGGIDDQEKDELLEELNSLLA